jgi:hypothetical protein
MTTLKYKKDKEFLWTRTEDGNEVFILGIKGKQFQRVQMKGEPTAQELLDASR